MDLIKIKGNGEIKDFGIGKYLVTQKEYEDIMGVNPSYFKGNKSNPVEKVSWYDAIMFCNKLSEREGIKPYYKITNITKYENNIKKAKITKGSIKGYRLPTNKEWNYMLKGGKESKGYKYSGSNDIDEVAWYNKNSGGITHPVGLKKPNELGIYDILGNVQEWTEKTRYTSSSDFKGGSWMSGFHYEGTENGWHGDLGTEYEYVGFRICCN
jgi:formylglycine-generating enzyme